VETEARVVDAGDGVEIVDNEARGRYEARLDGRLAGVLVYEIPEGWVTFVHTEVEPAFEGRGIGSRLAKAGLDDARARGLPVTPECPFVLSYVRGHPEYRDMIVGVRGPQPARSRPGNAGPGDRTVLPG
jgi:predicted GNAT family acetyltransferase